MSLSTIIQQYNQKLIHCEQGADKFIRSSHSHMLSVVVPHIASLLKQYQEARPVPAHWLYTGNRLASAKHLVAQNVNHFGAQAKAQILVTQHKAVILGEGSAYEQLGEAAPGERLKSPSSTGSFYKLGYTQQGKPIDELMDGFGAEASDRVGKALIAGVSIGQKPDTISRAIMLALMISLNRALVIEKTSAAEAFRASTLLVFRQNEDLSSGWLWTLGGPNPCQFCKSMAGTKHDLSEEMISHPNCFCYMQVIVKGN